MDYTPISARRVLMAFGLTAFVAVLPALFCLLQAGHTGPMSFLDEAGSGYRGLVLGAGSVILTMLVIAALMLVVVVGQRMVRRPSRA